MKKVLLLCITFCVISILAIGQMNIPSKPNRMVNDYASILSSNEVLLLENKLRTIDKSTGVQITLVTMATLNGYDVTDYALELGNKWGVGHKNDQGLVILLCMDTRKWSIQTGSGIEGDLPDAVCGHVGREYLVPNLRTKNYYEAFDQTINRLMDAAGMMTWKERQEQHIIKAEVEAKAKQQRLEAEKADNEDREKKSREFWDDVWSIVASLALFALPCAIIFFFYGWYKDWQKEQKRRKYLSILISNNWADVHSTMANIRTGAQNIRNTSKPQWVYNIFNTKEQEALDIQQKFNTSKNEISIFTKKSIKKVEKKHYDTLYSCIIDSLKKIVVIQNYLHSDLPKEIANEASSRRSALADYTVVTSAYDNTSKKMISEGYNLSHFNHVIESLINDFRDCNNNEEKLGKDFDNQIQSIVARVRALEDDIKNLAIVRSEVDKKLLLVKKAFPNTADSQVNISITLLSHKYQKDALELYATKWKKTMNEYEVMYKSFDEIANLNDMKQQRFGDAQALLNTIDTYVSSIASQKDAIINLDKNLQLAKESVFVCIKNIEKKIPTIKNLMTDSDVSSSTESNANTLLTKVKNFENSIEGTPEPDWISQKSIGEGLLRKLTDIISTMESEISDAEEERKRKKRQAEEEERQRIQRQRDAEESSRRSSYSSSSSSSDSGSSFGGGSFSGGGASGGW
jgi:uncharacterized membrane protein YgcG